MPLNSLPTKRTYTSAFGFSPMCLRHNTARARADPACHDPRSIASRSRSTKLNRRPLVRHLETAGLRQQGSDLKVQGASRAILSNDSSSNAASTVGRALAQMTQRALRRAHGERQLRERHDAGTDTWACHFCAFLVGRSSTVPSN